MKLQRLWGKPIITPELSPSIGDNINGPTVIKVPSWVQNPLGKYYLYFGHHRGTYIRLAYSDTLEGPWKIYEPGVLQIEQIPDIAEHEFRGGIGHLASPDIYIDEKNKRFFMYYHCNIKGGMLKDQITFMAISEDGINFKSEQEIIGEKYYWRVFRYKDYFYSFEMWGQVRRSRDGITGWENGPLIFQTYDVRHNTVKVDGDKLIVFFTIRGDNPPPEKICAAEIDISGDWMGWKEGPYQVLLKPETIYEGADCPLTVSEIGPANGRENALRDPFYFANGDKEYIFYCGAGESCIAVAELLL